jgi:alpha-beta hydrolase superfamily lysophospholipase
LISHSLGGLISLKLAAEN